MHSPISIALFASLFVACTVYANPMGHKHSTHTASTDGTQAEHQHDVMVSEHQHDAIVAEHQHAHAHTNAHSADAEHQHHQQHQQKHHEHNEHHQEAVKEEASKVDEEASLNKKGEAEEAKAEEVTVEEAKAEEAKPEEAKAEEAKPAAPKPPGDYDVERVARKAAEQVYGWLWEMQGKQGKGPWAHKYAKPLGDYDVERVAKKASANVYGWLWEKQAKEAMHKAGSEAEKVKELNSGFDNEEVQKQNEEENRLFAEEAEELAAKHNIVEKIGSNSAEPVLVN